MRRLLHSKAACNKKGERSLEDLKGGRRKFESKMRRCLPWWRAADLHGFRSLAEWNADDADESGFSRRGGDDN